jgi:GDPmannose 4,6-dehydratase
MKSALITGIAGQDGSYLAEHLLESGYSVQGLVRRNSVPEHQESRISHLAKNVEVHYADVTDLGGLDRLINRIQPEVIFNLAAQSHVRISFDIPHFTSEVNALGVLNILELIRNNYPNIRYYQASSSEMFGDSVDQDDFQRESTPMHPVSPYGCAKLFGYHITRNYRKAHSLFASNGILFNHESPRRGSNFVTSKVIKTAVQIKLGYEKELILGNLDSYRDWGHSKDYVRAMKLIMEHSEPDDFVVSTGITRSVRELVDLVFSILDLNYTEYVSQDSRHMRPEELPYLKGDSTKIQNTLGWKPKISFEEMISEMVEHWLKKLNN